MAKPDERLDSIVTNGRRPPDHPRPVPTTDKSVSAQALQVHLDDHPLPLLDEDRYRDDGEIGQGGMGEVQALTDLCLGRQIALKRLRPELLHDTQLGARFVSEARIQGQLEHPAIVPLYDVGTAGDAPFFTMKRVRGVTLREVVRGLAGTDLAMAQRFGRHKLLTAFITAAQAVHYAHARGVVHRDLKPQNIMLGDFGEVYVLDWGVAKVAGADDVALLGNDQGVADATSTATCTGSLLGTAGYMAPEQVRGDQTQVDERSDVYALGAILFELLTLTRLNPGASAEARTAATLEGRDLRAAALAAETELPPELPPELVAVCARATRLQRGDRFQTVAEMVEAIDSFLEGNRDAELRRSLSRAHTEAAAQATQRALRSESLVDRETAMSQIGRAVALDPDNDQALRLLLQMLTQPPKTLPPEVARDLEQEEQENIRSITSVGTLGYGCLLIFVPVAMWMGVRSWTALGGLTVLVLLCTMAMFAVGRLWPPTQQGLYPAYFAGTMMIAGISTFFGPLVVVPGMAAVHTIAFMLSYRGVRWWPIVVGCLAFVVPLGLQLLGLLHESYRFQNDSMLVSPWVAQLPPFATLGFLTLSGVALVWIGARFAIRFRETLNKARVRARLHTWQLEQLLPSEARH